MFKHLLTKSAIVICMASVTFSITLSAQDDKNSNGLYRSIGFDIGAPSGLAGVSYDQRFKPNSKYGFRTGIAYGFEYTSNFIGGDASDHQISIPFTVYQLFGNGRNNFELGLGIRAIYENEEYAELFQEGDTFRIEKKRRNEYGFSPLILTTGYRLVTSRRFQLRAGISAQVLYLQHNGWGINLFYPYVGFSWNL